MDTKKTSLVLFGVAMAASAFALPAQAGVGDTDQVREQRWKDLQQTIFPGKTALQDDEAIHLDAPVRPEDASLVDMTITLANPKDVKAVYLVIDDNPSPLAAHFAFGPDADPKEIKLRMRVDTYSNVHAVAETQDGRLIETMRFVKASGGCSAPAGMTDEEAMQGMGDMRVKIAGGLEANKPVNATLMIRHPNFNGMQMNQITRDYTPARYIQTIGVKFNDQRIFDMDTDISLSANPVISFEFVPTAGKGDLKVEVKDTKDGKWSKDFNLPQLSN